MAVTSIRASLDPNPRAIRLLSDGEGDRLRSRDPKVCTSPKRCITCGGAGFFRWWNSERTEVVEYDCPCVEQFILHRYLLNANVGLSYQRLGWADVQAEAEAVAKVRVYLGKLGPYVNAGCGLILYGEGFGTGKTLLATLIAKAALAQGYDAFFVTFPEMISMFTAAWHDTEEKTWFYRRVKNTDLLVLDDIGKEHRQKRLVKNETETGMIGYVNTVALSSLDEVLRHRIAASKPTIITSNFTLQQLGQSYGDNVVSLLSERSSTYHFQGPSFRDAERLRVVAEVTQDLVRPVVIG